ncbi:MAG: CRISPR locus-related DNA-binding protein [Candidatus Thorarchaeota archaeon]|nr:CRISPR locus-related DNA-binding protein [Candidatus Thorarchaeota archaeon]
MEAFKPIRRFIAVFTLVADVVGLKMRLHIATLGLYHNMLVEHVITKRGADKIAIIYTERNEEDLEGIKERHETKMVPVISRKVPPWDYHEVLSTILEVVSEHEDYEIEFNISCGTRVMTVAAYLAALFSDAPVFFVVDPDKEEIGDVIMVQPVSVVMLSQPKKKILQRLDELGGKSDSQKSLGSRTDLGASSISKHLNSLDAAGYISRSQSGRKTCVEITNLGRIVMNLKTFRKDNIWSR